MDGIMKELKKADRLISMRQKLSTSRKKKNNKKKKLRCFERVRNKIRDLHHKVSSYLCSTYRVILLPKFETQKMASSNQLHNSTCRKMLTWSHYTFQRRLIEKAQHSGTKVRIVSEAFTSKTCGRCGHVNESNDSKTFRCSACNLECDRDQHAGRNILLRNLPHVINF